MCLSMSPFLITSSHSIFKQLILNPITSHLIGILGFKAPTIRELQSGHVGVLLIHGSQNRLLQHGVSTASSKISRQIGQTQRSSDRDDAAK